MTEKLIGKQPCLWRTGDQEYVGEADWVELCLVAGNGVSGVEEYYVNDRGRRVPSKRLYAFTRGHSIIIRKSATFLPPCKWSIHTFPLCHNIFEIVGNYLLSKVVSVLWYTERTSVLFCIAYYMGHAVAQFLRRCAINWKVAGSIPDGVTGFFHSVALWSWGRLSL
jgi:hypothetical protein